LSCIRDLKASSKIPTLLLVRIKIPKKCVNTSAWIWAGSLFQ
jgi:hypothetical protein